MKTEQEPQTKLDVFLDDMEKQDKINEQFIEEMKNKSPYLTAKVRKRL